MPYRGWLLIALLVALAVSAIRPWHPSDFVIEHILTLLGLGLLVYMDRRQALSNTSCSLLFIFMLLHVVGAHYTYSEVPYDRWSQTLFGRPLSEVLGWERNHYDRLVHFFFGLLIVYPMRETLQRIFPEVRDGRLLVLAVIIVALLSKLYELIEWTFTLIMTQEAAAVYNGEQGDIRDAHKDMALALGGSIISAVCIYSVEHWGKRA